MDYADYAVEDFVKDEYFQKWIMKPDPIVVGFWEKWMTDHPQKRETVQCAANLIRSVRAEHHSQLQFFDADGLWKKILQKRNEIGMRIPTSEFKSKKHRTRGRPQAPKKRKRKSGPDKK